MLQQSRLREPHRGFLEITLSYCYITSRTRSPTGSRRVAARYIPHGSHGVARRVPLPFGADPVGVDPWGQTWQDAVGEVVYGLSHPPYVAKNPRPLPAVSVTRAVVVRPRSRGGPRGCLVPQLGIEVLIFNCGPTETDTKPQDVSEVPFS